MARVTICYPTLLRNRYRYRPTDDFVPPLIGSTFREIFRRDRDKTARPSRADATNDGCTANRIGFMMADFEVSRNDQVHWLFDSMSVDGLEIE